MTGKEWFKCKLDQLFQDFQRPLLSPMSEKEWLNCQKPHELLHSLGIHLKQWMTREAIKRKMRLFAVACARPFVPLFPDERGMQPIEIAERYADGLARPKALSLARQNAVEARWFESEQREQEIENYDDDFDPLFSKIAEEVTAAKDEDAAIATACSASELAGSNPQRVPAPIRATFVEVAKRSGRDAQMTLLREIFGNPFDPVKLNPCWLTSTVKTLAFAIYEERSFIDLPVLADALEDASCTDLKILNHCRQPGEHVRGCWVVDLILGKE
jgi:hypothetical protein